MGQYTLCKTFQRENLDAHNFSKELFMLSPSFAQYFMTNFKLFYTIEP